MHEWLEALRKSAKATSEGVLAEEVRRAETECGVPFPADLADLYLSLNGGEFQGEVRLYPLRGEAGAPSVLEKSRLMVVGLPAAGVWRFGLKGPHRHLFVARKSAMEEQGDGGGPLPGWMSALDGDDWVFGTWDGEKKEMRLYRTLKDMLEVLVPPVEEVESFGERTFARAMNAVLQGALSGAAADTGDDDEGGGGYASDLEALARDEDEESLEQEELFTETEVTRPAVKKAAPAPLEAPAVSARPRGATVKRPTAPKSAAKGSVPAGGSAMGTAESKAAAKSELARGAAKKAPGKAAASKRGASAAKKGAAKKGATSTRGASAAKKGAAKKGAAPKRGASAAKKGAAKKGAAPKRGASAAKKGAAKKGAAPKRGASAAKKGTASTRRATAAKKGATANKAPALNRGAATKAAARKPTAKKPASRRS